MKYAIIRTGGKQYKVTEGKSILVDNLNKKDKDKVEFAQVLLVRDGEQVFIGKPHLTDWNVSGEVEKTQKGKKIRILKFKAKIRYRKRIGFRPIETSVKIIKIDKKSPKKNTVKTKKTVKKTLTSVKKGGKIQKKKA